MRLRPTTVLAIAKDHDAGFGPKREEILVLFYGKDAHGRDGTGSTTFTEGPIFHEGELAEGAQGLDAALLLVVALQPDLAVRMRVGQGTKKGGWAIPVKVNGANKVCHGIESRVKR